MGTAEGLRQEHQTPGLHLGTAQICGCIQCSQRPPSSSTSQAILRHQGPEVLSTLEIPHLCGPPELLLPDPCHKKRLVLDGSDDAIHRSPDLTRAGQGLLNSEAELDELLERVLGHHIASGICEIARDTIQKGGDTVDQATHHWELILSALLASNLKLTAQKVRFFPEQTEIYGWKHTIDGSIHPSDHIHTTGDSPRKSTSETVVSRFFKHTSLVDGLLVVKSYDSKLQVKSLPPSVLYFFLHLFW